MTSNIVTPNGLIFRDRNLDNEELLALRNYGPDSTFFHAIAQGQSEALSGNPAFREFSLMARAKRDAIDRVFTISRLIKEQVLWSGHGHGWGVRGALVGEPSGFIGLEYRYPGYISTSTERSWCDGFLEKRNRDESRPTLMQLNLPALFPAIDMHDGASHGEFEVLLPRNLNLVITDAASLPGDILYLNLTPVETVT